MKRFIANVPKSSYSHRELHAKKEMMQMHIFLLQTHSNNAIIVAAIDLTSRKEERKAGSIANHAPGVPLDNQENSLRLLFGYDRILYINGK